MTGINRRLLLGLQLRCAAALTITSAAAGVLSYWAAPLLLPWGAVAFAAAEVAFYFIWHRKREKLDAIPEVHEPDNHDGWAFFEKWHASSQYNVRFLAIAELIKCWFDNVPTMEIRRGNAADLVARGYFYKTLAQLRAEGRDHLVEAMLCAMEEVWGRGFEEGLNPELEAKMMDHLQEPLKVSYRPLFFYLALELAAGAKHLMLLAAGFVGHTYGSYTYYTYNLPTQQQAAHGAHASTDHLHPVVFLHGVGAGLLPYIPFLLRVTALGRPVLAVEYKHLSMRWTDFIPTAPQVAKDMSAMFDRHGITKASLMAHSYGTFYVSCLLKLLPERVHSMALIDPVCCCMWSGHLISNFVYNPARSTAGLITWLISRDIHTATSVSRNFFWTDVNLWPDEIPHSSLFVLSEKDDLVPVRHVHHMVTHETDARLVLNPKMAHADFLFSLSTQDRIIAEFAEMVQLPSSPRAAHSKDQNHDSDSTLSPAWSVISDLDASEAAQSRQQQADPANTASCFKDSVNTLQFGSRLHHRARAGSSGSAGSDDDLYRAAQLAKQLNEHSRN